MRYLKSYFGKHLSEQANPAGWICALARSSFGLVALVVDRCRRHPDIDLLGYQLIIDDDTFVNIDELQENLSSTFHPNHSVLGNVWRITFAFPIGSFGTIFSIGECNGDMHQPERSEERAQNVCSRQQNFIRPIYCSAALIDYFVSEIVLDCRKIL
jgi:hypothetical protein